MSFRFVFLPPQTATTRAWAQRLAAGQPGLVIVVANAGLDEGYYPTGVRISKKELAQVPLTRHEFHGDWNYTVHSEPLK